MKKVLLFGSSLTLALAEGPSADRRLDAAWGQSTATGASDACYFVPTADLFAHRWITRSVEADGQVDHYEHVNSMDPNSYTTSADTGTDLTGTFVEDGSYTSNLVNKVTKSTWETDALLIARLSVDLVMDKYQTLTTGAQANYKFYDWKDNDWTATSIGAKTGSTTEGIEAMTAICVYKNSRPNCDTNETPSTDQCCLASDIGVDISSGGNGGAYNNGFTSYNNMVEGVVYSKSSDEIHVGLRKILGVATTCGEATGGDFTSGVTLDSTKDNIFVWAHLEATATAKFELTYVKHQVLDNNDVETGYEESATANAANDYDHGDDGITYTLTINAQQPQTHDLLFIEEPVESSTTLFSSRPEDAGGVTKYRVDYMDDYASTGGVTFTDSSVNMDCGLTLTVESQRSQHWHCFRSPGAESRPDSTVSSTDFTATDNGDAELNAFSITGSTGLQDLDKSGTCNAELKVTCSDPTTTITGTDTRSCHVIIDSNMNAAAIADRKVDYASCVTTSWFTTEDSFYVNHKPLVGSYETAIVQAVRLTHTRRYPKAADSVPATFISVGDSTKFPISNQYDATSNSNFQCGDSTQDCASEDPYVLLHAAKVEAELEFENGLGPFTTKAYDDSGEPTTGYPGDADDYFGDCVLCTDTDTSTWSTCKVYDKIHTHGHDLDPTHGLLGLAQLAIQTDQVTPLAKLILSILQITIPRHTYLV